MVRIIPVLLAAATSTQGLIIAVQNYEYYTNTNGGGVYGSPYCLVGVGNTEREATSNAVDHKHSTILIAGGHCDQLPYKHTNQLNGFWDDYGDVNFINKTWHWWCNPGHGTSGHCDAGGGYPRRKRDLGNGTEVVDQLSEEYYQHQQKRDISHAPRVAVPLTA